MLSVKKTYGKSTYLCNRSTLLLMLEIECRCTDFEMLIFLDRVATFFCFNSRQTQL